MRRKAAIGAEFKILWQRWDEVKMLKCLRMMDEIDRRAGLYVSETGTRLDLCKAMVEKFWG